MSLQPPPSAEEQRAALDEIAEEITVVRRHWNPAGDLPIIVMLSELNETRLRRLSEGK